jgi:hypothetical protein
MGQMQSLIKRGLAGSKAEADDPKISDYAAKMKS